jgi:hypothetical protein
VSDEELKSDFIDVHEICRSGWDGFLQEGELNMDYYHDAQFTGEEQSKADRQGSNLYVINKMRRQIDLLHGYEIRNRHILKIGPVEGQDDLACRQHTGVVMHAMSAGNVSGYDVLSNAFKWGPLVSGSNLIEMWKDREGNFRYTRHGYNQFYLDPGLTQRDMSDCDNILLGQWISKDKVKLLLPRGADKIKNIPPVLTSERWDFLGEPPLANKAQRRLYERWYRRQYKYVETLVNRISGKEIPFDDYVQEYAGNDENYARRIIETVLLPNGLPIFVKYSKPIPYIQLTIFVDGEPVYDDKDPNLMDDYSFVWLNGDWAPEMKRDDLKLQGFATTLRDPQKARTRRACQALDIMDATIHNVRLIRDKHIKNVKDTYNSGSSVPIHINDEGTENLTNDQIFSQVPGPDIGQGILAMMEILDKDLTEAGGLNEEIFGSDDKDIPGILHRYRTGQALTGQQGLFQNFRSAKRELGRKSVRLFQLNYDPAKIYRIINEWPTQGFYEKDFTKYDCTPTEGLLTDSQKHLGYLELKYLRETFEEFRNIITPSILVEYAPIQFKEELMRWIKQAEQAQQRQQQQMLEDKQRMDRLVEAQTSERLSADLENRSNAKLDNVRSMVEMGKIINDERLDNIDRAIKVQELRLKEQELDIKRQQAKQPKLTGKKKAS